MTEPTPLQKAQQATEKARVTAQLVATTSPEDRAAIIARVRLTNEALADELAAKFGGAA